MDMTEAEYVETSSQIQLDKVSLNILDPKDCGTIYNIIILEEDKNNGDGE